MFLGIGSNLSDRQKNIRDALCLIAGEIGDITEVSSVYETEPWGFESEDAFLNMVLMAKTSLTPAEVLERVGYIETRLGRVRGRTHYSSRTIDIDILLYNDRVIETPDLTVPHPLMHRRKFVLVPLCELMPDGIHPVLKETFASLLAGCNDEREVRPYAGDILTP